MARALLFDRKIGRAVWDALPRSAGVYRFFDAADRLIYVGKAKNLKRRLGQYRRAKRLKAHQKMRSILGAANRLEYTVCTSELEALELELQTIQLQRPKFNVEGAYSFLYPYVIWHLHRDANGVERLVVGYSLKEQDESGHARFGAFRSRLWARESCTALQDVMGYLAHSERQPFGKRVYRFQGVGLQDVNGAQHWHRLGSRYLRGESPEFLAELALQLLERVSARRDAAQIEEWLKHLRRFWKHELQPLGRVIRDFGITHYPIAQRERDAIFLKWRQRESAQLPAESRVKQL